MTHLLLNIGGRDAGLNQQRAEGVAQVVKAEFPEPSLFERRFHVTWTNIVREDGSPSFRQQDQIISNTRLAELKGTEQRIS